MSLSAIDKIDMLGASKSAQKSITWNYSDFYGYGGYIPSGDLPRDGYGAAAAYSVIVEIFAAIAVWETFLDGVTWIVKEKSTGQEIARTDVQGYPIDVPGGKWYKAVKDFELRYFHSYFKSLAYSDWLFGSSYIVLLPAERQFRPNHTNYIGLKWLNPLNTEPMVTNGKIQYYTYTGMDAEGYYQIPPEQMAYRINRRNAFDDLRGYSGVLAAMDAINLSRNAIRAFKNFFSQGMQLGGVIMPKDGETWSPSEHEQARREWTENHKGAANAGRWAILRRFANITPYGQEDASQNFTVTKDLRNTIYNAMNVPPQLAGDPSDATYDNAKDIKRQWWETFAIPYAKDIAGYHNNVVIPKLEPNAGIYIEADLSPYETEDPEVIAQDVSAGYIDIATAQGKRGYPVDEDLRDIYMVAGRPMSKMIIMQMAHKLPASEAQAYAQAEKYEAEADSVDNELPASDVISPYLTSATETKSHAHSDMPIFIGFPEVSGLEELASWRKFCMNGKSGKRPFMPSALRGDIGDMLQVAITSQDKQAILSAFHLAQETIERRMKAIQATRLDFENDFDSLLSRARSEKMGRVQWASAMRSILRRYGERAYIDGLADGGVEDEPSEDDLIAMNQLHSQNSAYVTELGNVLYKEDGVSDELAEQKAAMWFNKSINPYYQAGLVSADGNSLYEWVYGDTEHCETCRRLNGQRHRLKGWQARYMPQGDNLDCHGFNCKCKLVRSRGRARGTY